LEASKVTHKALTVRIRRKDAADRIVAIRATDDLTGRRAALPQEVFMIHRTNAVRRRVRLLAVVAVGLMPGIAWGEEPHGCDAFKWPVKADAALLHAADRPTVESGASARIGNAVTLKLVALDAAALPMAPERAPKTKPSQAGFLRLDAPAAGAYQITISQGAWIDVIQNGHYIKPTAFSGALDCPDVRKSLRVTLSASPLTLQVSGTEANAIGIAVLQAP
jgi:hypothetical protein